MSHTYSSIFFHVIWSTKNRLPIIDESFEERLHRYIGGIARQEKCEAIVAGVMPDHIHVLIRTRTQYLIADLVRKMKSNSSKFINNIDPKIKFSWQEGYGAFSVSASKLEMVKNYILKQKEHHKINSFMDEFLKLLNKHEIEYDGKYLFK